MKLATAALEDGTTVWGQVLDGRLHDVSDRWTSPVELLTTATDERGRRQIQDATSSEHRLEDLRVLPPVPHPERILCVGINYADHAAETGRTSEPAAHPVIFTRFASSLVGHGSPIERPSASRQLDYEGELAVVIGHRCRGVDADDALAAVGGYSCFMDGSVRDFQRHTSQFIPGKNFDRSGAWGPWIVTTDDLDRPGDLELTTSVGGDVLQQARTSQMIHDVAAIVSYCSRFTTLEPGDVIATGTPAGVGAARTPPRFLVPGDEVRVAIEGIGTLVNPVVDEDGDQPAASANHG